MTQNIKEFSQFRDTLICREYTLSRDEEVSEQKVWIKGNINNLSALEFTTCCLKCKYGVEIRIWSMSKDNSHSWVIISHDVNKNGQDLNNNEKEISEIQFGKKRLNCMLMILQVDQRQKQIHKNEILSAHPQEPYLLKKKTLTDVDLGKQSLSDHPVPKQLSTLLRHDNLLREDDGAIEIWELEDYLQIHFEQSRHWSDEISIMTKDVGKIDVSVVLILQDQKFFTSELFKIRTRRNWFIFFVMENYIEKMME